jgi:hypothetical protein
MREKVADRNLSYPIQGGLFTSYRESTLEQGLRTRIAQFYEILTAAIVGGEWNRNRNMLENGYGHLHPDVICDDRLIDAKAVCAERPLKLRDIQFEQYFLHQGVSTDNRKIFYSICRYEISNPIVYLRQKENALGEIVSILSKKTDFIIFLPFSAVINMHNPNCSSFSRYEKDKKTGKKVPDPLTQIPQSGLIKLFTSPEIFLDDCGINSGDYLLTRTTFPSGIRMNEHEINQFPILQIEDKDYERWLIKFRADNSIKIKALQDKVKTKRRGIVDNFTGGLNFD